MHFFEDLEIGRRRDFGSFTFTADNIKKFAAQFLEIFQRPGFRQLLNLGCDGFADAGDFGECFFVL